MGFRIETFQSRGVSILFAAGSGNAKPCLRCHACENRAIESMARHGVTKQGTRPVRACALNRVRPGAIDADHADATPLPSGSAVVGSIILVIALMRLAGKPPRSECSRIAASFGAM